jgi:conjugal transfer/type IV secretion protein DotA/TraY
MADSYPNIVTIPEGTLPSTGSAGEGLTTFDTANDQGIKVFDFIFGSGWESLATGGGGTIDSHIIMSIFSAFNSVVLMGTSIIVVYMLAIGTMGTAHEGTPLGRQYNTLYTPLRMAFSVSLLAPIPGAGISMLQAMLLAVTYFGFGGANLLTTTATSYMSDNNGSVYAMPTPSGATESAKLVALEALVIQEYQIKELHTAINGGVYSLEYDNEHFFSPFGSGEYVFRFNTSSIMSKLNAGEAGVIRVFCHKRNTELCASKKNGIATLIEALRPAATSIYEGNTFAAANYAEADSAFNDVIEARRREFNSSESTEHNDRTTNVTAALNAGGWTTLGQYYWIITEMNDEATSLFGPGVTSGKPNLVKIYAAAANDPKLDGMIKRAGVKVSEGVNRSASAGGPVMGEIDEEGLRELVSKGPSGFMDHILNSWGRWIAFGVMEAITANERDPVSSMAASGHIMIGIGEAAYIAGLGVETIGKGVGESAAAVTSSGFVGFIPGPAAIGAFFKGAVIALVSKASAILTALAGALVLGGASLAFYLPLVPFIMYTLAVIGVYILILESLIAAPLWAAAIAMPQGEGMLGDHGKQGFMLFAGILFRPALLVAGFFISWLLMAAIGPWVVSGIRVGFIGITEGRVVGLISILAILFITGVVMITISHKVFGLITWLPNNVMRWMGQQMSDLGENRETEAVGGKVGAVWAQTKVAGAAAAAPGAKPSTSKKKDNGDANHT